MPDVSRNRSGQDKIMSVLIVVGKVVATLFLAMGIIVASFKANPRTHNPEYGAAAEYMAGFIMFFCCLLGLYYLWFK